MPRYFRHYYSFSLERLNGTEYAAIWDGDDEMEHAIYNYNHNTNGAMTFDSMSGISGTVFSWNAAGLLHAFVLLCTGITSVVSGAYPFHFWLKRSAKLPSSSAPRGLRRSASNFSRRRANWRLVSRVNSPCSIQEK